MNLKTINQFPMKKRILEFCIFIIVSFTIQFLIHLHYLTVKQLAIWSLALVTSKIMASEIIDESENHNN